MQLCTLLFLQTFSNAKPFYWLCNILSQDWTEISTQVGVCRSIFFPVKIALSCSKHFTREPTLLSLSLSLSQTGIKEPFVLHTAHAHHGGEAGHKEHQLRTDLLYTLAQDYSRGVWRVQGWVLWLREVFSNSPHLLVLENLSLLLLCHRARPGSRFSSLLPTPLINLMRASGSWSLSQTFNIHLSPLQKAPGSPRATRSHVLIYSTLEYAMPKKERPE